MLLRAKMNSMGHITLEYVNKRISMADVYFQFEDDVQSFIASLPKRRRSELEDGYTVIFQDKGQSEYFPEETEEHKCKPKIKFGEGFPWPSYKVD